MSHTSLPTLRQSVRVPENCPNVDIILKLVKSLENLIPQQNRLLHMKPRILENVLSILKSLLQRLPNTQINNNPYSHLNVENNNSNFAYSKLIDNIIQMRENSVLESKQNNERSSSNYECQIILQLLVDTVKSVYNQVNAYCVSTGKCDLTNIAPLTNDLISNNDRNLPDYQAIKQIYNTMNLHQHSHHGLQNLQNIAEQEIRNFPLDNKLTPNDINHRLEKEELLNLHTLLLQELINSNSRPDEGLSNVNSQNLYDLTLQELLNNNVNSQIQNPKILNNGYGLNDLTLQELLLLNNNIEPNINDNNANSQIQYQNTLNGVQGSNDLTLQELPLLNNNIGPVIHGSNVNPQIQNPDLINNIQGSNSLSIEELLELSKNLKPGLNGMNQLQNPYLIGTSSQSNYQTYLQQLLLNALNSHSNEANVAQLSQNQNNLSLQQLLELNSQLESQNNINSQLYDNSLNDNIIKNYNYNRLKDLLSIKNSPGANINANILGPLRNRIESSLSLGVNNITANNNIMNSDRLIHSGNQHLLNQPLRSNYYANQWDQLSYLLSKNLNGNGQDVNINKIYDNYPVLDDANNIYSSLNNYIQNNQAGYTHNSYQNQLDAVTAKIDLQKQSAYYNNYLTSKNILGINQGAQDSLYPGISTSPNSYVNPYLINTLVPNNEKHVNYDNQLLVNSPQTLSVSNFDKSNLVQANNKIIELTYSLNGHNYNEQPLYYVKYRIPYNKFLIDMENLMTQKPYLRNQQKQLYSQLISTSNIIGTSKNLIDVNPVDLVKLTHNSGTLMDAKVLEDQIGLSDEQLKLIRDMNAKLSQSNLSSSNASIYKSMNLVDKLIASANPATMVATNSIVSQTTEATAVPPSGISLNGVDVNSLYNSNSVVNPNLNYILNTYSSPSLNYNSNGLSKHNLKYSYNNYGKTISPANNYVLPRPYINPLYRQTVGYVSPYAKALPISKIGDNY